MKKILFSSGWTQQMAPPSVRFKQTCFLFVQRQLLETGSEAGSANWHQKQNLVVKYRQKGQLNNIQQF